MKLSRVAQGPVFWDPGQLAKPLTAVKATAQLQPVEYSTLSPLKAGQLCCP